MEQKTASYMELVTEHPECVTFSEVESVSRRMFRKGMFIPSENMRLTQSRGWEPSGLYIDNFTFEQELIMLPGGSIVWEFRGVPVSVKAEHPTADIQRAETVLEVYVLPKEEQFAEVECVSCKERIILPIEDVYTVEYGEQEGEIICEVCYSDDLEQPIAKVLHYDGEGDKQEYLIGDYRWVNTTTGDHSGEGIAEDIDEYIESFAWRSTGTGRGFNEGVTHKGWIRVVNDWCGFDGYGLHDGLLGAFHHKLEEEHAMPPFEMIVAFPRGSNLLTIWVEVLVPENKEDEFYKWVRYKEE